MEHGPSKTNTKKGNAGRDPEERELKDNGTPGWAEQGQGRGMRDVLHEAIDSTAPGDGAVPLTKASQGWSRSKS